MILKFKFHFTCQNIWTSGVWKFWHLFWTREMLCWDLVLHHETFLSHPKTYPEVSFTAKNSMLLAALPASAEAALSLHKVDRNFIKQLCPVYLNFMRISMSLIAICYHSKFSSRHFAACFQSPLYPLPHLPLHGQQKEVTSMGAAALPLHCRYHHFFWWQKHRDWALCGLKLPLVGLHWRLLLLESAAVDALAHQAKPYWYTTLC